MAIHEQIWPLVVVGRGSSAAFYLSTLDLGNYAGVLGIGDGDAWSASVRGHHGDEDDPTKFINHPLYLISHFRSHLPGFSAAKVDRLDWAEMNKEVLVRDCNVSLHDGRVKSVSEVESLPQELIAEDATTRISGYKIDIVDYPLPVYAYKVVMAAGAGGHRVPGELAEARSKKPDRVIDLDEFAKLTRRQLKDKIVFVYGPNAAIDAVQKAIHYQCEIVWLIQGTRNPPVLATQPAVQQALEENPQMIVRYKSFKVLPSIGTDTVLVDIDGQVKQGHYFVYGMGQTGGPTKAIDSSIRRKLVPVYDKNDYLGGGASTILAYEADGTGLLKGFEVVGAMNAQIGRLVGKDIKEFIAKVRTIKIIHDSIQSARFKVAKPFLLKDPDFLAKQPLQPLQKQLRAEANYVVQKFGNNKELEEGLEQLVTLILRYHSAAKYRTQLNQQAFNMPKGAVADAGQLSAIRGAMAAKHNYVPKYVGSQAYGAKTPEQISRDKQTQRAGGEADWVSTETTPGGVNFSVDNATVLQIAISLKYPFIPDDELNSWVASHMQTLRDSGVGFVDNHQFDGELSLMNQKGLETLRRLY